MQYPKLISTDTSSALCWSIPRNPSTQPCQDISSWPERPGPKRPAKGKQVMSAMLLIHTVTPASTLLLRRCHLRMRGWAWRYAVHDLRLGVLWAFFWQLLDRYTARCSDCLLLWAWDQRSLGREDSLLAKVMSRCGRCWTLMLLWDRTGAFWPGPAHTIRSYFACVSRIDGCALTRHLLGCP